MFEYRSSCHQPQLDLRPLLLLSLLYTSDGVFCDLLVSTSSTPHITHGRSYHDGIDDLAVVLYCRTNGPRFESIPLDDLNVSVLQVCRQFGWRT